MAVVVSLDLGRIVVRVGHSGATGAGGGNREVRGSNWRLCGESADKLDERRDATTRAHGGLCIVAAVGTVDPYPTVAATLWAFVIVIALGWLATLKSLTTKLMAKNTLLTSMEADGLVPFAFLTTERTTWGLRRASHSGAPSTTHRSPSSS